jgi:hypothetical protein
MNNQIKMVYLFFVFVCGTFLHAITNYEDAESKMTNKWQLYDNKSSEWHIGNIYDSEAKSQVITFGGKSVANGYILGAKDGQRAWNNKKEKNIEWSIKSSAYFSIYISVQTKKGHRYIYYTPSGISKGFSKNVYVHHGLGLSVSDGKWHTFRRNLTEDLKKYESDNEIITVNAFLIRGEASIDNITLFNPLVIPLDNGNSNDSIVEDGEDRKTDGWTVSSGGTVSNVYDSVKGSRVIKLSANEYKYYTLGIKNGAGSKKIKWDMKINKSFYVYVNITTRKGRRFLYYSGISRNRGLSGIAIHYGLGSSATNGVWQTYTRDIEADLKGYESDNSLISIDSFKVRATDSSYVDNIELLSLGGGIVVGGQDITAPIITLNGTSTITLKQGSPYIEQKATAIDGVDGSVVVNISGLVNVNRVGTYTITYTARDKSGNKAVKNRIVNVVKEAVALDSLEFMGLIYSTSITSSSAMVVWSLNNLSSSMVEYGLTNKYGMKTFKESSFSKRTYSQSIIGLKPNTLYHYRVISEDKNGYSVVSNDQTFKTLKLKSVETIKTLTEIAPPDLSKYIERSPRKMNSIIPAGFVEKPFIDSLPLLSPTVIEKTRGYILYSRAITQPVFRKTHPQSWERLIKLSAFATKGEYEPLTFSLYPLKNVNNLRVVVSDLSSGNAVISQDNLDLRAVTYWNIRYPSYLSKGTYRMQPELLEEVNSIALTKGINQRFWIKIHVPTNTPAGIYRGYVTLYEEGASKGLQIPIEFKVLNFALKRDPKKHYSAYFGKSSTQFKKLQGLALETARTNELKSMLSYGLDQFPSIYLSYVQNQDKLIVHNEALIDEMVRLGFKGPIPLVEGMREIYDLYYPKGKYKQPSSHWDVPVIPPANHPIYNKVEQVFRSLKEYGASKGWPEFIVAPMDEVNTPSADFAGRVFQAVKRAGIKTFINKNPNASDVLTYQKLNAVDSWCSKTYVYSYDEVKSRNQYDYWIYPNHNSGEVKNQTIMQKGGRMTYGYGLWKSGYSTLFPWHWHWIPLGLKDQFDYLGGKQSGSGMRMDENQKIIPAVYWEAFREGYDDLRYLYTLQDSIVKRAESPNTQCQILIQEGKKLLQEIWDSIVPQSAYEDSNVWSDESFKARRLQIATLIEKLVVYPTTNQRVSPSVLVNTRAVNDLNSDTLIIERNLGSSLLLEYDLAPNGISSWKSVAQETTLETSGNGNILFSVNVDLKHNSTGGRSGKLINWPRISTFIRKGEIILPEYDYLYFKVKITSNRSTKIDFATPMLINFQSYEGGNSDYKVNLGTREGVWVSIAVPIKEMITNSNKPVSQWNFLKLIQFTIAERFYMDKTKFSFEFKEISLVKFTKATIQTIDSSEIVSKSSVEYPVTVRGYGFKKAQQLGDNMVAVILDNDGKEILRQVIKIKENVKFIFNISNLKLKSYKLKVSIVNLEGSSTMSKVKKLKVIP